MKKSMFSQSMAALTIQDIKKLAKQIYSFQETSKKSVKIIEKKNYKGPIDKIDSIIEKS